jgi:transposase-like protein
MSSPEPMPSQREHLRARIAAVLKQQAHKRRYGNELKRAIVDYAFARQDEGVTIGQIAAELGLSAWLLGKWLRHARLRLEKGKIPFEPGEPLPMPWLDPKESAAEPSTAGSSPSQAEPAAAGSAPSSLLPTEHTSGVSRDPASDEASPGQASTRRRIVIPAASLAEFLVGAVASHGSIRRVADGIGVPYSTLRGWLRGRGGNAGNHGEAFSNVLAALRGHLDAAKQHLTALLSDVDAMGRHLDTLEHLLGCESDAREQV